MLQNYEECIITNNNKNIPKPPAAARAAISVPGVTGEVDVESSHMWIALTQLCIKPHFKLLKVRHYLPRSKQQ